MLFRHRLLQQGNQETVRTALFTAYMQAFSTFELKLPNCSTATDKFWMRKFHFLEFSSDVRAANADSIRRWLVTLFPMSLSLTNDASIRIRSAAATRSLVLNDDQDAVAATVSVTSSDLPVVTNIDNAIAADNSQGSVAASSPTSSFLVPFDVYTPEDYKRMRVADGVALSELDATERSLKAQIFGEYTPRERYALFLTLKHMTVKMNEEFGLPADALSLSACVSLVTTSKLVLRTGSGLMNQLKRRRSVMLAEVSSRSRGVAASQGDPWLCSFAEDIVQPSVLVRRRNAPSARSNSKRPAPSTQRASSPSWEQSYREHVMSGIGRPGSSALAQGTPQSAQRFGEWSAVPVQSGSLEAVEPFPWLRDIGNTGRDTLESILETLQPATSAALPSNRNSPPPNPSTDTVSTTEEALAPLPVASASGMEPSRINARPVLAVERAVQSDVQFWMV